MKIFSSSGNIFKITMCCRSVDDHVFFMAPTNCIMNDIRYIMDHNSRDEEGYGANYTVKFS